MAQLQDPVQDRVRLTADAVDALLYYYASPEPFTFSLADYLLLLYFEETCLTVTFAGADEPVLQTTSNKDLAYRGIDLRNDHRPSHTWQGMQEQGITFTITSLNDAADFPEQNLLVALFEEISVRRKQSYKAAKTLIQEFCLRRGSQSAATPPAASIQPAAVNAHLSHFQGRYWNRLMREFGLRLSALNLLKEATLPDGAVPLNLFTVVRYRPSTGYMRRASCGLKPLELNYAARILLDPAQAEWAAMRLGRHEADVRAELEAPLGEHSRWVADTVFQSGSLFCGADASTARRGKIPLDNPGDPADRTRHAIETALYGSLGSKLKIVYYPIHVGGTPWLALYSFASPDSWEHYLHIYRQIIPYIGVRVRRDAQLAFVDRLQFAVEQPIRDHPSWTPSLLEEINAEWLRTALVFPFPAPRVVPLERGQATDPSREKGMFAIGDMSYEIQFPPDAVFFPLQVDFGQLTDELRTELAGRIKQAIVTHYTRRSLQLHGIFNLGHELKNAIFETGWSRLQQDVEKHTPEELLEGDFFDRLKRGLSHMLWPASLVGLTATLGKAELLEGSPEKLRLSYLDAAEGFQYGEPILEQYRQSVRYLVNYVAALRFNSNRPFSIVEWPEEFPIDQDITDRSLLTLARDWKMAPPGQGALDIAAIRFPPIVQGQARGEAMRFAVASLLSEPVRNAAKALTDDSGRSSLPVLIWSVTAMEDEIRVCIANTLPESTTPDWKFTSGRLVNALGRMLGIGSVDVPVELPTKDALKLVSTVIHLHPNRLGNRILT